MEAIYLQEARDGLQGYILPCEETGEELERTPYAMTTCLTLRGLPCVGKEIFSSLYQQDPRKYARRLSEVCRALGQLAHPNIAQFLGVHFTPRSTPLVVMEHLSMTLGSVLDLNLTLPDPLAYGILTDVILAFRYLHERATAVVHRDFNANNVLLTDDYRAKISDLGIAKIADTSVSKASRLTKVPGTLCYMAPEVLVNSPKFDASSNIFSYGILTLHLLSGQWPLPTEATILDPNLHDRLIPVSEWDRRQEFIGMGGLTHPLASLAKSCLSNNPSLRPKAAETWKAVAQVSANVKKTARERMELIMKLKSSPNSMSVMSKLATKKADLEPSAKYENHLLIEGQFSKQRSPLDSNISEWGKNRLPIPERGKSSPGSSEEPRGSYENQLSIGGQFSKQRSPLESSNPERGKHLPTLPERGKSSTGASEKWGGSSSSLNTERWKQPPPVAGKNKPSSSSSPAEKQFSSVLEKSKSLFDHTHTEGKRPGSGIEKESKDPPVSRFSSRLSKTIFEEQVEKEKKAAEPEQWRPRVNSNVSDSVSKLTKMFAVINEPQTTSPVLPKTAPKPTKSGRWRSQQEVESQMKAAVVTAVTRQDSNFQDEDTVEEVYDSYVDMTPKILEEESKVRIFAKVIYDYSAEDEDELTITVGETVEVVDIQEHDDQPQWWLVRDVNRIIARDMPLQRNLT